MICVICLVRLKRYFSLLVLDMTMEPFVVR
jgi:hypothetical protein